MDLEKEKYLFETYNKLFPPKEIMNDPYTSCLALGIECGDGWFSNIEACLKELSELKEEIKIAQIKEKFGGLRIYLEYGCDKAYIIISKYAILCDTTCEICGKTGTLIEGGWWRVRCEEHNK